MEMILKLALFDNAININILHMFIFLIPFSLTLKLLSSLAGSIINKIFTYFGIISVSIIFIAQLIYYKTYLSIFSIYSMGQAKQLTDYIDTIIKIIIRNWFVVLLFILPLIVFIFVNKYFMSYERIKLRNILYYLVGIIFFQLLGIASLKLSEEEVYSAQELYNDIHSPTLSTSKLGLLTTMRIDCKRLIMGFNEKRNLNNQNKADNENEGDETTEYNVMDIDFDSLIANEDEQSVIDLHNYFKTAVPTNKNEYTGLFEGKNLIVLLGESFDPIAIDEVLTPTLYKLAHEGLQFTNFYSPLFPISTSDGEYMTMTSLLPVEGVWSAAVSSGRYFPFVLGNSFKSLGYKTTAYHDHIYTYYFRHLSHPAFGYDYYACGNGLDINCNIWPESDLEMVDATYDDYMTSSPFLTYYVTVSGHLNYSKDDNAMAAKNWSYVKDLPYSDSVKAYLACNIELDRALASLLKHLEETGTLQDTVIALSPDHYPYGLTMSEINEVSDYKRDDNFDKHHSRLILWNSEIQPVVVDKLSSSIDILPTLLNLFGVEYDSRMLMGKDIFSDAEPIVIFSNRSFITNRGRYNAITNQYTSNFGSEIESDYVDSINLEISNRFYLSRSILDTNYYFQTFNKTE
jgi:phosphoglycerol transferase MdoB-like AlkP superfamily enzyme